MILDPVFMFGFGMGFTGNRKAVADTARKAKQRFGGIDVLVNNAGSG